MDDLMDVLEERQNKEKALLEEEIKLMMKGAKKAKKRDLETKAMQMEYDLRAKHIEETDFLEEHGYIEGDGPEGERNGTIGATTSAVIEESPIISATAPVTEPKKEAHGLSKKEKAQRKKDKKLQKEQEKLMEKERLKESLSSLPSQREEELALLNQQLLSEGLEVKNVAADGHCLYRAIADQLQHISSSGQTFESVFNCGDQITFVDIRKLAAKQMRDNVNIYAPFLALEGPCEQYDAYCDTVENVAAANWGGQTEINAIATRLGVPIWVYEVGRPVLKMGGHDAECDGGDRRGDGATAPLKITYHRHFYALGEHYNSVKPIE